MNAAGAVTGGHDPVAQSIVTPYTPGQCPSFPQTSTTKARHPTAQQPPPIQFDEVPIDEARRMGRGPRMAPELYNALKDKNQSLDNTATRLMVPEGTNVTTMKNRILRVAAELNIPVTIRSVPGGLLFWHSSEEDLQQATEVGARLQTRRQTGKAAQQRPQTRPRGRRPRGTR